MTLFKHIEIGDWFIWEAPVKKENSLYAIKIEEIETDEAFINALCLKTGAPLHFVSSDRIIKIKKVCLDNFVDI